MKRRFKYFLYVFTVCVILFIIFIIMLYNMFSKIQVRQTKDYNSIIIEDDELADYRIFIYCDGKYNVFRQIGIEKRTEIANFMFFNNLRIKSGTYEFIRINPSLDELLNNFEFEEIASKSDLYNGDIDSNKVQINIKNDIINSNYLKKIIYDNVTDNTNLSSLNDVILYNIYLYLKENNLKINSGNYIVNTEWWFINGLFFYNDSEYNIFRYTTEN